MIERRAVLGMRALLVSPALLGACDAGAKPEPRPQPAAPTIYVRGGDITFAGKGSDLGTREMAEAQGARCDRTPTGALHCVYPDPPVSCEWVVDKVPSIAFAYDPKAFAIAPTVMPTLLASCMDDRWPEDLKHCLFVSTPQQLVHEHACTTLVTPELVAKVAKRFGVAPGEVQSMLDP